MIDFITSLGVVGYFAIGVLALCVLNVPKLIKLRTPLDSQQHKTWRGTGGTTPPDHLIDDNKDSS